MGGKAALKRVEGQLIDLQVALALAGKQGDFGMSSDELDEHFSAAERAAARARSALENVRMWDLVTGAIASARRLASEGRHWDAETPICETARLLQEVSGTADVWRRIYSPTSTPPSPDTKQ
jgi:hypothetical protein